jgi:hypothetical protein
MNMVLKQKDILDNSTLALSVSVSPFDMLYYVRQTKPGESTLATPRMLELICIAHAEIAKRQGNELLRNLPAPRKRESSEARRRVDRKQDFSCRADGDDGARNGARAPVGAAAVGGADRCQQQQ